MDSICNNYVVLQFEKYLKYYLKNIIIMLCDVEIQLKLSIQAGRASRVKILFLNPYES